MNKNTEKLVLEGVVPVEDFGMRLDQCLSGLFPQYSRSNIQKWIVNHKVKLNDVIVDKKTHKVKGTEAVYIEATLEIIEQSLGEAMSLDIVYEDEALLVVNKPANLVVHPAAGNLSGTLLNGLLNHCPDLATLPRAGIIHRIDKDTTGLLVVAKNLTAHHNLVDQLQNRAFKREYVCLVSGHCAAGGTIDLPIGRHPTHRIKMAVVDSGKEAITHFRVVKAYPDYSLLRVRLETGRTHQIRVHMAHKKMPIVGDPLYGGRLTIPKGATPQWTGALQQFKRQALHARILGLQHPDTDEFMEWKVEWPDDFSALIELLDQTY